MQATHTLWLGRGGKASHLPPPGFSEVPGLSASLPGRHVQLPRPVDPRMLRRVSLTEAENEPQKASSKGDGGAPGQPGGLACRGLQGAIYHQEHLFFVTFALRGAWATSVYSCEEEWLLEMPYMGHVGVREFSIRHHRLALWGTLWGLIIIVQIIASTNWKLTSFCSWCLFGAH